MGYQVGLQFSQPPELSRPSGLCVPVATLTALCVPTGVSPFDPLTRTFYIADSGSNVVRTRERTLPSKRSVCRPLSSGCSFGACFLMGRPPLWLERSESMGLPGLACRARQRCCATQEA